MRESESEYLPTADGAKRVDYHDSAYFLRELEAIDDDAVEVRRAFKEWFLLRESVNWYKNGNKTIK